MSRPEEVGTWGRRSSEHNGTAQGPQSCSCSQCNSTSMAESTYCVQRPFNIRVRSQGALGERKGPFCSACLLEGMTSSSS